jgi:hypothetical protein
MVKYPILPLWACYEFGLSELKQLFLNSIKLNEIPFSKQTERIQEDEINVVHFI